MMKHMTDHALLSNQQYGFIEGRSTTLQLLTVLDDWTSYLDQGKTIDVVYCDFRKAFDKVPHRRLLEKVKAYGFRGKLLEWLTDFLLGRHQRVFINNSFSDWSEVRSGIPQGSVLGPMLFVLYVNDLPNAVSSSSVFLFADDLKMYHPIQDPCDQQELQSDISKVQKWTEDSLLELHPEKCVTMTVHTRGHQAHQQTYTLGQAQPLKKVEKEKDIGVTVDSQLKFQEHLQEKINKANRLLGVIWRTFEYKDEEIMVSLYKSLIRPHLEYANQAWAPHLRKDIESLESVQRRATRMIPGMKDLDYHERLQHLNLPTLAYRRLRGEMIELYKMTHGLYEDHLIGDRIQPANSTNTRGHSLKLKVQGARLDLRKHSFFVRAIEPWNHLSEYVVQAPSIAAFERRLDQLWKDHPLRYDHKSPTRAHVTATVAQQQ